MESDVSQISPVLVEVKVQVPWDRVSKNLNAEYTKLGRTAKIRGFRPGKVPRHVLKQLFGKQVNAEVTGTLVEEGLMAAVQKHALQIVAQPTVEDPSPLKKGEPFQFTAKVEVRPTIEKLDLDGLEVWQPKNEITDEAVDAEVERLRKQQADLREPDPMRPAKASDQLTIDYRLLVDGEPLEDFAQEGRDVILGEGDILDELNDGLMGVQPGETRNIEIPFPDDHPNPELVGKTGVFEVKVTALRERLLPEIDDEFAKDCGDFETYLELRLDIRKRMQEMADQRTEAELKEKLVDTLIDINDIPVPPSMIKQQQQQMLYEMMQFAQMMGQQMGAEQLDGMEARAERRVKAGIILGALARIEGIEVDEAAFNAKLQEMAEQSGKHIAKLRVEYAGERRDSLMNQILEEKIMAFLKTKATVHEGEPPAEENATEEKAAASKGSEEEE